MIQKRRKTIVSFLKHKIELKCTGCFLIISTYFVAEYLVSSIDQLLMYAAFSLERLSDRRCQMKRRQKLHNLFDITSSDSVDSSESLVGNKFFKVLSGNFIFSTGIDVSQSNTIMFILLFSSEMFFLCGMNSMRVLTDHISKSTVFCSLNIYVLALLRCMFYASRDI